MADCFLMTYLPPRETFPADATPEEAAVVEAHFEYLKQLYEEGVVTMVGRRTDARFGLAVIATDDPERARTIASQDPAVESGVFSVELADFRMVLYPGKE